MKKIQIVQIEMVRHALLEGMETHFSMDVVYATEATPHEISKMAADLSDLCNRFETCQSRWKDFSSRFARWKQKRTAIIKELEDIACQLDTHKYNSNIAKLVGGSVGAAGGVLTIVGISLAPFTFGASTLLSIAGISTAMTGGTVGVGTAITETIINNNKVSECHELLKQHEKDSESINEKFQDAVELVAAADKIIDFKVFREIIQTMQYVFFGNEAKLSSGKTVDSSLKLMLDQFVQKIPKNLLHPGIVPALGFILSIPKLFRILWRVVEIYNDNLLVFETVFMSARIGLQVARGIDLGVDAVATAIQFTRLGGGVAARSVAKAVAHGIFAGLGLALDVTSVVLASVDVHNGSKNRHAKEIRKAKKLLEDNLEHFSELSQELCSSKINK